MFEFMRNLLWWRRDKTLKFDGTTDGGYYKLPGDWQRKCMTPKQLAILLSKCEKETPAYILVEHELNRRIAKIQAISTYVGIVSGLAGVVLGAWLNSTFQSSPIIHYVYPASTAKGAENETLNRPTPPGANAVPKEPIKPLSGTKPVPKDAAGKDRNP